MIDKLLYAIYVHQKLEWKGTSDTLRSIPSEIICHEEASYLSLCIDLNADGYTDVK